MSKAKKVTSLPVANTVANTDLFIIEKVGVSNSTTHAISGTNLRKALAVGPFASDAAANTGGVAIGELYYTATGEVKIRLT